MYHSPLEFLRHILDECDFIVRNTKGKSQQEIEDDEILSKAIVRSLEIIGEATKKLSPDFVSKYQHVSWKDMAGMRDHLIHNYFGIDYDIVYQTIHNDIPVLQEAILFILKNEQK